MNLLPCPFCGGTPEVSTTSPGWKLRCRDCGVESPDYYEAEQYVVEFWNERPRNQALELLKWYAQSPLAGIHEPHPNDEQRECLCSSCKFSRKVSALLEKLYLTPAHPEVEPAGE